MYRKFIFVMIIIFSLVLTSNTACVEKSPFYFSNSKPFRSHLSAEDCIQKIINFSKPNITLKGENIVIKVAKAKSTLKNNNLLLPVYTFTVNLPWNTKLTSITCKTISKGRMKIPYNLSIIQKNDAYPTKWYSYNTGVGLYGRNRSIFLTVRLYPVRCISRDEIEYAKSMQVKIYYQCKNEKLVRNHAYDFLIIAPDSWMDELQPLKEHKEARGIKTIIVGLDEIYGGKYFTTQGRDEAEKIKYFIKNAIEEWGINYVLLIGDDKNLPVRYTNLDNGFGEHSYISDLYYADVYKYKDGKIVFEDWDSNGNGIFAEWDENSVDILDLYPDVYIGRLPCRNEFEVKTVINKIINYEENAYGKKWFKRMIVCGGDTFADHYYMDTHFYEGELITQEALKYMEDFESIKLWGTKRNLHTINIWLALNKGAGFVYFSGHGNPFLWVTRSPYHYNVFIGLWGVWNLPFLSNGEKLPVVMLSGCATAQFNLSIECISWWFVRKINGGSIATLGYTAHAYGGIGDQDDNGVPDCIEYKGGYLELQFFRFYREKNISVIGELWGKQ